MYNIDLDELRFIFDHFNVCPNVVNMAFTRKSNSSTSDKTDINGMEIIDTTFTEIPMEEGV